MTLAATIVWEVQTGGNDANGGGFVSDSGGTDWSQQAAAKEAQADGACSDHVTFVFTSAAASFQTDDAIGNLIRITDTGDGGHFVVGTYEITGVTNETTVTLDRDPTDGTNDVGADYNMGGALATPGMLGKVLNDHGVAGMKGWVKAGTYSLANSSANTAGGPVALKSGVQLTVEGYNASRGDRGTKPILDANAETAVTLWLAQGTSSTNPQLLINLKADGQDGAGNIGFNCANPRHGTIVCEAVDCPTGFIAGKHVGSKADSCGTYGFLLTESLAYACEAIACADGFSLTDGTAASCLAHNCTDDGFVSIRSQVVDCTAWNNTGDGFSSTGAVLWSDCLAVGNTGYGFNGNGSAENCATYGNTAGSSNGLHESDITALSGDPFVDSGGADFRPDNTAGEGAALRGASTVIPSQSTNWNADIGAVQHTDPAGGGGGGSNCIIGG